MTETKTTTLSNRQTPRPDRSGVNSTRGNRNAQGSGTRRGGAKRPINAKAAFDRYVALAHSAATSGDPIEAENYYQHAEHYFRLMNAKTT